MYYLHTLFHFDFRSVIYYLQVLSSLRWTVSNDEMQKKAAPSLTNGRTNLKMIIGSICPGRYPEVKHNIIWEGIEDKLNSGHKSRVNLWFFHQSNTNQTSQQNVQRIPCFPCHHLCTWQCRLAGHCQMEDTLALPTAVKA